MPQACYEWPTEHDLAIGRSTAMADNGAPRDAPAQPIGRIRSVDDDAPSTPAAAARTAEETGWSLAGIGLGVLLVLLMIGAMVIILWAVFQTRT
jgi:hypothetical protein